MKTLNWVATFAIAAFLMLLLSHPASAQATRTWVSGVGDDANPCSRTAPCKTFAGAISKTSASGEINCLDPAGFGALTITKAITILCDGVSNGGVLVAGTNGFVINAGPNDQVTLSGLDFEGLNPAAGPGLNGINFINGRSLTLQNTTIRDFSQNGVLVSTMSPASVTLNNVTIIGSGYANTGTTYAGVQIQSGGNAAITLTVNKSQIIAGLYGIVIDGTSASGGKITGAIRDTVVASNTQNGVTVSQGAASVISLLVDNVTVEGNGNNGLSAAGAGAGLLVVNSSVVGNGGGLHTTSSGVLASYGNNRVNGNNGADGVFTSTVATK